MLLFRRTTLLMMFTAFMGPICFVTNVPNSWAETFPLDEEAVFCIYYRLSGEKMTEEDMEDLNYELGRSSFTAHKPSEMFTKKSLVRLNENLMERMRSYNDDTLFLLNIQCRVSHKEGTDKYSKIIVERGETPQPTPYIRSEISKKGQSVMIGRIQSFIGSRPKASINQPVDVIVYLRPEKIDYQFDKRNVAREEMVLPIRYVIFRPIQVKLFDEIVAIEKESR